MKLKISILLLALCTSNAFAQGWQIPYPAGTPRALNTPGTTMSKANINTFGDQLVAATSIIPGTTATSLGKAEDALFVDGQTGVTALGVRNTTAVTLAANEGANSAIGVNRYGSIYTVMNTANMGSADLTSGVAKIGHAGAAYAQYDGGIPAYGVSNETLALRSAVADKYMPLTTDRFGRLIALPYAPSDQTWHACGTSTAVTSDVVIKASAGATSRIYVTGINCKNTSATVGTTIDFKDAATVISVGGISSSQATAAGSFSTTFPVPLRGTANTALNFAANVAVTSLTCCGVGYTATN